MKKENLSEVELAAAKVAKEKAAAEKAAAADKVAEEKAAAEKVAAADKPAGKAAAKPAKGEFNAVFESNPNADEIFVVDGMPFLEEIHALNYARGDKQRVKTVRR